MSKVSKYQVVSNASLSDLTAKLQGLKEQISAEGANVKDIIDANVKASDVLLIVQHSGTKAVKVSMPRFCCKI